MSAAPQAERKEKPRRRAHRWDPVAVMASRNIVAGSAHAAETNDDDNVDAENDEHDVFDEPDIDPNATTVPVVVFCPYAAKGSQKAEEPRRRPTQQQQQQQQTDEQKHDNNQEQQQNDGNTTATKKRNKDDIVTATAFWLVDATINRVIGRLEKDGLVAALSEILATNELVLAQHLASHQPYVEKVLALLPQPGQRAFFVSEFIENPSKRKFGNQAVGHPPDLKCAHALVAQSLVPGLTPCPLGEVVAAFIVFVGEQLRVEEERQRREDDEETEEGGAGQEQPRRNEDDDHNSTEEAELPDDWHVTLIPHFKKFAVKFFAQSQQQQQQQQPRQAVDPTRLYESAKRIVDAFVALGEGHGRRRKRRTD